MRLVAPDLRPLQLDVAASSISSLVPKTGLVPKTSLAPIINRFRIAPVARAVRIRMGETDNLAG
jgi:hypothetical protein